MSLLRTVLALVVLLIVAHAALVFVGIERSTNALTEGIYGLGALLESPAVVALNALGESLPVWLDPTNFYAVALVAAAGYLLLYLLLGLGGD
jgi:hypothetical protein